MDECGAVELLLEDRADLPEWLHLSPADLDGTGTGNAVALANEVNFLLGHLQEQNGKFCYKTNLWN